MGIFSAITGTASETDGEKIEQQIRDFLASGEHVIKAYQLVRDLVVFTDRRIITIDYQGITGKKTEYTSIPYRCIVRYSVETTGHLDIDSEVRLWLSGQPDPVSLEFRRTRDVSGIIRIITEHAC